MFLQRGCAVNGGRYTRYIVVGLGFGVFLSTKGKGGRALLYAPKEYVFQFLSYFFSEKKQNNK
jgi:hypothetical protein